IADLLPDQRPNPSEIDARLADLEHVILFRERDALVVEELAELFARHVAALVRHHVELPATVDHSGAVLGSEQRFGTPALAPRRSISRIMRATVQPCERARRGPEHQSGLL